MNRSEKRAARREGGFLNVMNEVLRDLPPISNPDSVPLVDKMHLGTASGCFVVLAADCQHMLVLAEFHREGGESAAVRGIYQLVVRAGRSLIAGFEKHCADIVEEFTGVHVDEDEERITPETRRGVIDSITRNPLGATFACAECRAVCTSVIDRDGVFHNPLEDSAVLFGMNAAEEVERTDFCTPACLAAFRNRSGSKID